MEKKPYVLAMYDVRGKQNFIFRSTHLKEIVGGSCIIRDCYRDYLFPAAKEYRDQTNKPEEQEAIYAYPEGEAFRNEAFRKRMESGKYIAEIVYEGGGNFLVLYRDKEAYVGVNKIFTKTLLEKTHSLKVLSTMIEIDGSFADFDKDRKELYEKHRLNEGQESVIAPVNTLPIVQVEYRTSMPLTDFVKEKVSRETAAKLEKYKKVSDRNKEEYGEKVLDRLIRKKGEESLLAVIFIDGNGMGAKVQNCLKEVGSDYDASITGMREFSAGIQKNYVDDRMKDIDSALEQKYGQKDKRRFVVYAGDEMSFICNARDALTAVKAYFSGLPNECSACAGIAVFHSHAPYAEAYKIAEECCEEGKKVMKKKREENTCYLDFHYCQGGMGMDLETIRERECKDLISKPWFIKDNSEKSAEKGADVVSLEEVESVVKDLNKLGSRTNIKGLAEAAVTSLADFNMEMSRIYAHQNDQIKKEIKKTFELTQNETVLDERRRLQIIYDIVTVYDLWFREEK